MNKRIEKRTAEEQFLIEVATFADSPAGQAMLDSDPAMTARIFIDRARKLIATKRKGKAA
jgi:hypothetical protein